MHWQKSGDYLCVKVDRFSKVKKEKGDQPKYSVSVKRNISDFAFLVENNITIINVKIICLLSIRSAHCSSVG